MDSTVLAFDQDDTPETKLDKLERVLAPHALPVAEVVPLLATLLMLPLPTRYPPLILTPQRQKQKTLEALLLWLLQEAEQRPVLFVVEDLHWMDPSTLEFLSLLVDQVPTARILVLLTCRPEFASPWSSRAHVTQITLAHLPRHHVERLMASVAAGKTLPVEVVQQIVHKTDGVPLFVEELTKTVLESGLVRETQGHYMLAGSLPSLAIPTTLHDALMARLDRLATVKMVAQWGATIGRQFAYDVLQTVALLDEGTLQQGLAKLVEAELLYQRGMPPRATYRFKHALIQEAAYESLLKSTRQQYHQRIAQVLVARFPEIVETQPELLAHHYMEAGLPEQAVGYWQRAGQRAVERSAHLEAIAHFTEGLEVLTALSDTPERLQYELDMQTVLGPALIATKGFGAPDVETTYARARELCRAVGGTSQPLPREVTAMEAVQKSYEEMLDLFARGTTPAKILAFRPSQEAQQRVLYLLARNKTGTLTEEEAAELDRFGELEHLMQLVKARAHLYVEQSV